MGGVFVSYAREDVAKAKTIARALENASFDVWFDEKIFSGSEFSREIEEALARAGAVVVLWSQHSVQSPWVRDEAAEGRDSGRIVPVLLDECRPPIGFRQFQATDLARWSGRGVPPEIDNILAAVGAKPGMSPKARPGPTAAKPPRFSRRAIGTAGALAVVAVSIAALLFFARPASPPIAAPSLALMPFTADSSDAEGRRLASAVRDALAHALSQSAFAVHVPDSAPQGGAYAEDFMLSGQVRTEADKIFATVRMEEREHRFVVFSNRFEMDRGQLQVLPERIAAQIAAQLSWTAPLVAIERRHPSDPAIIAAMLQQVSTQNSNFSQLQNYETNRRLARKAPNSANANLGLAFNTGFALGEIPRGDRSRAIAAARQASDNAVTLAPEFGDAYIPWCLLHSEQRRIQCEDRLRVGVRADPDAPFANTFLSRLLNTVGRNGEAANLASLSLAHDQFVPAKIGLMLRMFEATGQVQDAADLYRQASRWWPSNEEISWQRLSGMIQRGDFNAARQFAQESDSESHSYPVLSAAAGKSLAAVQNACSPEAAEGLNGSVCMLAFARLGDLDAAFALADRLYPSRRGRTAADEERIWLDAPDSNPVVYLTAPVAAPMRRDPRFIALAERVGLLEYWRSGRAPDWCRDSPEEICSRLRARA